MSATGCSSRPNPHSGVRAGRRTTRILVCEAQTLLREGLCSLLERVPMFYVVGQARTLEEFSSQVYELRPDVGIVSTELACSDGYGVTTTTLTTFPSLKLLLLSDQDDAAYLFEAKRLGVHGLASKQAGAAALANAVTTVMAGELHWGGSSQAKGRSLGHTQLGPSDMKILQLLALGRTNQEIGLALGLREKSVRNRLTDIYAELGVRNRIEAAMYTRSHLRCLSEPEPPAADVPVQMKPPLQVSRPGLVV